MLGARATFSKGRFVDVDTYLYTHASPQWRGSEPQAPPMDIVRRRTGAWSHHLPPCTRLSFVGKCVDLLHQLCLCVGSDYDVKRYILAQVVSITADFGVESELPVMPDLLPEFFASRGIPLPRNTVRAPKLFPRAVLAPGFGHLCDSMAWFPLFLTPPQGVADGGPKPQGGYGQHTCGLGRIGDANKFRSVSRVFFAHLRWGTLSRTCQSPNKLRDAMGVEHAKNAVFSKEWMGEFQFASWFANIWAALQSWGSGCSCHEEELTSGKKIVCPFRGRRIPDAWRKVPDAMDATAARIHCRAAGCIEDRHSCCACEVEVFESVSLPLYHRCYRRTGEYPWANTYSSSW